MKADEYNVCDHCEKPLYKTDPKKGNFWLIPKPWFFGMIFCTPKCIRDYLGHPKPLYLRLSMYGTAGHTARYRHHIETVPGHKTHVWRTMEKKYCDREEHKCTDHCFKMHAERDDWETKATS